MSFDFDRIADEFDATRSFDPRLIDATADAVLDLLGQGASVIDIGCGTGRFLLPLTRKGVSAVGIDISKRMLLRAGEKGLEALLQVNASHLPFIDRQFDASFLSSVLHLLEDWKGAIREACRVSRSAVIAIDPGRKGNDTPHDIFKSIMREKGFMIPQKGPYESELCDSCPPAKHVSLAPFEEIRDRKDVLAAFGKRTFTYQAELTPEQNRECVEELSERLFGEEIRIDWEPALIIWDPRRLSEDIERITFCYPH